MSNEKHVVIHCCALRRFLTLTAAAISPISIYAPFWSYFLLLLHFIAKRAEVSWIIFDSIYATIAPSIFFNFDLILFFWKGQYHRVIILNRGSMFACQWREFSPPLSSAHRLLQCYHSQWEIGDAAILENSPSAPRHYRAISQWARSLEWRHAVTLHILVGKVYISFFLFFYEGMLSLVVLWLCG